MIPSCRQISSTDMSDSACHSAKLICSSLYRLRFLALPPQGFESAQKFNSSGSVSEFKTSSQVVRYLIQLH